MTDAKKAPVSADKSTKSRTAALDVPTDSPTNGGTRLYRLTRGTHTRYEGDTLVRYKAKTDNDLISMTAEQAHYHANRLEEVKGEDMPGQYEPVTESVAATEVSDTEEQTGEQMPGQYEPLPAEVQGTIDAAAEMEHQDIAADETFLDRHWKHVTNDIFSLSSVDDLHALRDMETSETGKNRQSVIEALDARIAELEG